MSSSTKSFDGLIFVDRDGRYLGCLHMVAMVSVTLGSSWVVWNR